MNIGRRLGLYKAMAEIGACTSDPLAQATGVRERYVREWLNNQAAGGYVDYEAAGRSYNLRCGRDHRGPAARFLDRTIPTNRSDSKRAVALNSGRSARVSSARRSLAP